MSETKLGLEALKWIEDDEHQSRPRLDLPLVVEESYNDRFVKKTKENIFVPLGLIATATCLGLGLLNLQRGDVGRQQFFMRGRVIAQGFTLAAMVTGVALNNYKRKRTRRQADCK